MSKIPDYLRGHNDAIRMAVFWLHKRAETMNDPHAKNILNSAANDLGGEYSRARTKERSEALPTPPSSLTEE